MRVLIRPARRRDWLALAVLMRDLFPDDISTATARGFLLYQLQSIGVAQRQGRVIGFYLFHAAPDGGGAWLNFIGVAAQARRSAVGSLLLRAYEAHAARRGFRRSSLDVYHDNTSAMHFYEEAGYTRGASGPQKIRYTKALQPPDEQPALEITPRAAPDRTAKTFWRLIYLLQVQWPLFFHTRFGAG